MRFPFLTSLCLLVLMLSLPSCKKEKITIPPKVTVVEATNQDIRQTWTLVGQTVSDPKVDILARVKGFLVKRNFKQGAFVKKGELLFQIEKDEYQANVSKEEAQLAIKEALLKNALIVYNRSVFLQKKDTISKAELDKDTADKDSAIGERDAAKAALKEACIDLSYTDIKAPFDGRIGLSKYSVGNVIGPDSGVLATIVSLDPMKVEFNVNEADFLIAQARALDNKIPLKELLSNLRINLILSDKTEYKQTGKIYFWNNAVSSSTGTILMRASFENKEFMLNPGQYVKVKIQSSAPKARLLIPQEAIQSALGGKFVMIVDNNNMIQTKKVKTGYQFQNMIVITKGLNPGDKVVTQGIQKVRREMKVTPIFDKVATNNQETKKESEGKPLTEKTTTNETTK